MTKAIHSALQLLYSNWANFAIMLLSCRAELVTNKEAFVIPAEYFSMSSRKYLAKRERKLSPHFATGQKPKAHVCLEKVSSVFLVPACLWWDFAEGATSQRNYNSIGDFSRYVLK